LPAEMRAPRNEIKAFRGARNIYIYIYQVKGIISLTAQNVITDFIVQSNIIQCSVAWQPFNDHRAHYVTLWL
jgi:hypothetical protein